MWLCVWIGLTPTGVPLASSLQEQNVHTATQKHSRPTAVPDAPRETLERLQDILQARTPAIKSSLGSLLSVFLGSLPYPQLLVLTYMQSLRPRLWLRAEPSTAAELAAGLPTLFSRLQVPCLYHERLCSMASLFISNPA